jgi:hypothetical protein
MNMLDKAVSLTSLSILSVAMLLVTLCPVVYNTDDLADTIFLVGVAWRIFNGAVPVVDFGHFYGGFSETYISWAFSLFGVSIKALDYALLLQFATTAIIVAVASWRRISVVSFWMLLLVSGMCILTRAPFEYDISLTSVVSAHSFVYNRFALALTIPVMLFAILPVNDRNAELTCAIVIGATLYMIALTKPSFVVFLPAVFLALALQARFRGLFFVTLGLLIAKFYLDFGAARFLGSSEYLNASISDQVAFGDYLRKGFQLLLAQPVGLAAVVFAAALIFAHSKWRTLPALLAATFVMGGGVGMAVSMGGAGSIGQQLMPLMASLAVVIFELSRRLSMPESVGTLKMIALTVVAGFSLPHFANIAAATIEAVEMSDRSLITDGPLKNYISMSAAFELPPVGSDLSVATEAARQHLAQGNPMEAGVQYPMLADGINVLKGIEGISELGVVADGGFAFDFALGAPPVLGFPVWIRDTSPELAYGQPLPDDVAIVMLRRSSTETIIRARLEGHFVLCTQTAIWDVFSRLGESFSVCDASEVEKGSGG